MDGTLLERSEGSDMAGKRWIQNAIKKPGSFTAQAKRAGKSVAQYAQEKKGAPGKTGKRARLAITLRGLNKKR
jgi:hypothetical protein